MLITMQTRGRPKTQITWDGLPEDIQTQLVVFVHDEEEHLYKGKFCQLYVAEPHVDDLESMKDVAVEVAAQRRESKVIIMDDDLTFFVRRTDVPTKFIMAEHQDIRDMFAVMEKCLDYFAHVSVSPREGANWTGEFYRYNCRPQRIHGYNVKILRDLQLKFKPHGCMEDFGMALELLTRGYPNCIINNYVHNQPCSQAAGGCSIYRTAARHYQAASNLAMNFPRFVKLVKRPGWAGESERFDVRVQWKAAFNSGRPDGAVQVLDRGAGEGTDQEGGTTTEAVE